MKSLVQLGLRPAEDPSGQARQPRQALGRYSKVLGLSSVLLDLSG